MVLVFDAFDEFVLCFADVHVSIILELHFNLFFHLGEVLCVFFVFNSLLYELLGHFVYFALQL